MGWVNHRYDVRMPSWLADKIDVTCPYCGADMYNYYDEKTSRCTNRRCSNELCIETNVMKALDCVKMLGIKGIADGTLRNYAESSGKRDHIDILIGVLPQQKIKIAVSTVGKLLCMEGVDKAWESEVSGFSTFTDYINSENNSRLRFWASDRREQISKIEEAFEVVAVKKLEHTAILRGNVMITGNINGYDDRKKFLPTVNYYFKGLTDFVEVGKRKTGVYCLIAEDKGADSAKMSIAHDENITIYTSKEFLLHVRDELAKKQAEGW